MGAKRRPSRDLHGHTRKSFLFPCCFALFLLWSIHLPIYRHSRQRNRTQENSTSRFGRLFDILRYSLHNLPAIALCTNENKTKVFNNEGGRFVRDPGQGVRLLSTVLVNEELKRHVLRDAKEFCTSDARKGYARSGIPYRKGYLLHGPEGTGKTTFAMGLAGELGIPLYVITLSDLSDSTLKMLFGGLPSQCLVLLEDVDHIETDRSTRPGLTLSGLLNVIDGVGAKEGRILVMTKRHADRLDGALVRPGRVDWEIKLGFADASVISQVFKCVFLSDSVGSFNGAEVEQLADGFVDKVPENTFSVADLLSYLQRHRTSPAAAVTNVTTWVTAAMLLGRKEIFRRDSFASSMQQACLYDPISRWKSSLSSDSPCPEGAALSAVGGKRSDGTSWRVSERTAFETSSGTSECSLPATEGCRNSIRGAHGSIGDGVCHLGAKALQFDRPSSPSSPQPLLTVSSGHWPKQLSGELEKRGSIPANSHNMSPQEAFLDSNNRCSLRKKGKKGKSYNLRELAR